MASLSADRFTLTAKRCKRRDKSRLRQENFLFAFMQ
jgi:hypothetical protein